MDWHARFADLHRRLNVLARDVASWEREVDEPGAVNDRVNAAEMIGALASYLALGTGMAQDDLLNTILVCATHVTGAGGAGLTLFDPQKRRLVFQAAVGEGAEGILGYEVPLEGSQHGLAFATGEVQAAAPLHSGIEAAAQRAFRSVLVAPLVADGESIGTLSAVNKRGADQFTVDDMRIYRYFADIAALLVRQRLREEALKRWLAGDVVGQEAAWRQWAITPRERQLAGLTLRLARLSRTGGDAIRVVDRLLTTFEEQEADGA